MFELLKKKDMTNSCSSFREGVLRPEIKIKEMRPTSSEADGKKKKEKEAKVAEGGS